MKVIKRGEILFECLSSKKNCISDEFIIIEIQFSLSAIYLKIKVYDDYGPFSN